MIKISVLADSRKKQQHLRSRDPGCLKKTGISAHTPRANTAETSGRNARPALPRQTLNPRCGDSSAGDRRAVCDIRRQCPAVKNYCSFSSFLFFTIRHLTSLFIAFFNSSPAAIRTALRPHAFFPHTSSYMSKSYQERTQRFHIHY